MIFDCLLQAPTFIINLERSPERLKKSKQYITNAGFQKIIPWKATDAKKEDLKNVWMELLGEEPNISPFFKDFQIFPYSVGCLLSHLRLWKYIIQENIELAVVFEDDVLFHSDWDKLAPKFWAETPTDFDILYLGSNPEANYNGVKLIDRIPVMCTHAYVLTTNGALRLLQSITTHSLGYYALDGMLFDIMLNILMKELVDDYLETTEEYRNYIYQLVKIRTNTFTSITHRNIVLKNFTSFKWYIWNAITYRQKIEGRSIGLVFQDLDLESTICNS